MSRLLQRTTSGVLFDPNTATSALTPAFSMGAVRVYSVTVSALTAAVWNVRSGITVGDTTRLTMRVPIGQTNTVYMNGANFSNGIYVELASGTGEISVEFG